MYTRSVLGKASSRSVWLVVPFLLPSLFAQIAAITPAKAKAHFCEEATVCGYVLTSIDGVVYLDSEAPPTKSGFPAERHTTRTFAPTEPSRQTLRVKIDLKPLVCGSIYDCKSIRTKGTRICVIGRIVEERGFAQINVLSPSQLRFGVPTGVAGTVPEIVLETPSTVLPQGTPVALRVTRSINSKEGGSLEMSAIRDLERNGLVIVRKGATASAHILSTKARRFDRPGRLEAAPAAVSAVTGTPVSLQGEVIKKRGSQQLVGEGAALLLPFLPLIKGGEAIIPRGTKFCGFVVADTRFDTSSLRRIQFEFGAKAQQELAMRKNEAWVHLYRFDPAANIIGRISLDLDGQELARFSDNRSLTIRIEPGRHVFRARGRNGFKLLFSSSKTIDVNLAGGTDTYIRLDSRNSLGVNIQVLGEPNSSGYE
jgi:hypothetical protein